MTYSFTPFDLDLIQILFNVYIKIRKSEGNCLLIKEVTSYFKSCKRRKDISAIREYTLIEILLFHCGSVDCFSGGNTTDINSAHSDFNAVTFDIIANMYATLLFKM